MRFRSGSRFVSALLAGGVAVAASVLPGAALSAAPPPPPPLIVPPPLTPAIVQHQTGIATGNTDVTIMGGLGVGYFDSGHYASTGQLGRGTYHVSLLFPENACSGTTHSEVGSGNASIVRSDGTRLTGTATESFSCVNQGSVPDVISITLSHGARDLTSARLTFTGKRVLLVNPSGDTGTEAFTFSGTSTANTRVGYWMVDAKGVVHAFGGAQHLGDVSTPFPVVHIEPTRTGAGYWVIDSQGHVFAFGDAKFIGNAPRGALLDGDTVTSLSATPSGNGYWLFTSHGIVLPYGDAESYGDLRGVQLNGPVIGSAATPTGLGYYLVASDGGVFTFGDAKFRGSMGGTHLNQPVNGLVPTADNTGYWLVASDGGVFAFHAPFLGSMGSVRLASPVVGMVRYGHGYMMVAGDGGIFDFSRRPFFGSLGGSPLTSTIAGAAAIG